MDRPEEEATLAADLRARLDALPPNHPSSAGFADRATSGAADARKRAEADRAVDRRGDGVVDEGARVFQPAERAIADALAGRGAVVTALAEDHSLRCRQPDALVDDRVTEFKSVRPGATDATIKNQLLAARGQAPNVVVDARGSGLGEDGAALGLRRFLSSPWGRDHYETILILGDGYVIETARREEPADDPP
ncbi:MAG TPA: hypothetical protein VGS19_27995 [Streptosporangiaceae bacterium]|nr:hypothetical protein [Streptosporangiaceae bacterium]